MKKIDRYEAGGAICTVYKAALDKLEKQFSALEVLNPDVPCPVCDGNKIIKNPYIGIGDFPPIIDCEYCNAVGKVSLLKALQFENEQLEKVLDELEQQRDKALEALQDICKMGVLIDAVNIAQKALKEIKAGSHD